MRDIEVEVWSLALVDSFADQVGLLAFGVLDVDAVPSHTKSKMNAGQLQQSADQRPFLVLQEAELLHLLTSLTCISCSSKFE